MQGDKRSEGCQRQKHVEDECHGGAQEGYARESLLKNIGEGDKHERRTRVGADAYGKGGRENHQAGKYGHHAVYHTDFHGCGEQGRASFEVRGVCADTAHGNTERIERLTQSSEKHLASDLAEVGLQEEGDATTGTWQKARCHHHYEEQDEECGHEQFGHTLYAFLHATRHHQMGDDKKDSSPENRLPGVGGEIAEVLREIIRSAVHLTHGSAKDILQAPARHHGIVAGDEKAREHSQET